MILGEDYEFIDSLKTNTVAIKLNSGPYKDVVFRYTKMSVKENSDDTAALIFDYELITLVEHTETSLRKDYKFIQHIGLVLNTLILDAVEHSETEEKNKKL